jgi:IS30 family transposase
VLGRAASTVSREINRNGGSRRYRAAAADKLARKETLRPKPCKLAMYGQLRHAVATKLELNWSPEQDAGWLKRTWPGNEARCVSRETIYRSLCAGPRCAEEGAYRASSVPPRDAALPARNDEGGSTRQHSRRYLD